MEWIRDDVVFRILKREILNIQRYLPKSRKSLAELLNEDPPQVVNRDGTIHTFKREELVRISKYLSKDEHKKLLLPIYIELGELRGYGRIRGNIACKVILSVLGKREEIDKMGIRKIGEIYLNKVEIMKVREELPTTTQFLLLY